MKIPFVGSSKAQATPKSVEVDNKGNYAQELREFVQRNAPADFRGKFEKARPFIFASFVTWPMFWLYRGLEWGQRRQFDRLPSYINRTFLQAKGMQIVIIASGIAYATLESSTQLQLVQNVFKNVRDKQHTDLAND